MTCFKYSGELVPVLIRTYIQVISYKKNDQKIQ
jgi:hypothetical protein